MLEAIEYFEISEYDVMVPDRTIGSNSEKVKTLLDEKGIDYSTYSIHHAIKDYIPFLLRPHKKYQNIFIGDYYNPTREAMAVVLGKKNYNLCFIDDGTQALSLFSSNPRYRYRSKKWEYWFRFCFFFGKIKGQQRPRFFTIFDVESDSFDIIKNNFHSLGSHESKNSNGCFIIGANSCKLNFLDISYLNLLNGLVSLMRKQWPNESIVYCPHRGDSNNESIREWCSQNRVEWYNTRVAVEYDFVEQGLYPKCVMGFTSNALYTLKKMFPNCEVGTVMYHLESEFADNETGIIRKEMNRKGIETIEI